MLRVQERRACAVGRGLGGGATPRLGLAAFCHANEGAAAGSSNISYRPYRLSKRPATLSTSTHGLLFVPINRANHGVEEQ